MICSATAPAGLTIGTRKEGQVQVHYGNREGNLVISETEGSQHAPTDPSLDYLVHLVSFMQPTKPNNVLLIRPEASLMPEAWVRRRISCGEVFVPGS